MSPPADPALGGRGQCLGQAQAAACDPGWGEDGAVLSAGQGISRYSWLPQAPAVPTPVPQYLPLNEEARARSEVLLLQDCSLQ